ncbi:MAG: hypothetical protein J5658_04015 [Prevotella sp.]|nr:hypothetical protein [Prevotella sp.]
MTNATQNIRSRVEHITPEMAREYLTRNNRNRPINKTTVEDYARQIEQGLWKLNGEAIIISSKGNVLDGQHRLKACCMADQPIDSVIIEGVDEELFSTIDTGRARTAGDIFAIDGINNPTRKSSVITAYFNLRRNEATYAPSESIRKVKVSKQEILDFYRENEELVTQVTSYASSSYDHVRLLTISTMGAYILYLIHDRHHPEQKVYDFFCELTGASEITNQTVSLLRDALLRNITKQRVLTISQRNAYIIKAWNAYITGKELKNLSYNKSQEGQLKMI